MDNDALRVRLGRSPLRRVVCQLRYPRELGFDASLARPFQKALAPDYPHATPERVVAGITLGPEGKPVDFDIKDVFRFQSEDGATTVQLADEFVALETTAYAGFRDFGARWRGVLDAAVRALDLRTQVRLGLRYTNAVEDARIDDLAGWRGHVADWLLDASAALAAGEGGRAVAGEGSVLLRLPDGLCAFRHGFPRLGGVADSPAPAYILDIDSYDERTLPIDAEAQLATLSDWNHRSVRLLRGAVTDALWASFEPGPLP